MIQLEKVSRRIDAAVVAVLFLVRRLVSVQVVRTNIVPNVVSVVVRFPRTSHVCVGLVRINIAQSVLFAAEPSQKRLGGFAVDVRVNTK
jgi:hypothetical protein